MGYAIFYVTWIAYYNSIIAKKTQWICQMARRRRWSHWERDLNLAWGVFAAQDLSITAAVRYKDKFVEGPINHKIFIKTFAEGLVFLHDPNITITSIQIINRYTSF